MKKFENQLWVITTAISGVIILGLGMEMVSLVGVFEQLKYGLAEDEKKQVFLNLIFQSQSSLYLHLKLLVPYGIVTGILLFKIRSRFLAIVITFVGLYFFYQNVLLVFA